MGKVPPKQPGTPSNKQDFSKAFKTPGMPSTGEPKKKPEARAGWPKMPTKPGKKPDYQKSANKAKPKNPKRKGWGPWGLGLPKMPTKPGMKKPDYQKSVNKAKGWNMPKPKIPKIPKPVIPKWPKRREEV